MTPPEPSRRRRIRTSNAPAAIGPYSQGVLVNGTLYVSGQIGQDPETGQLIEGDIQDETAQILDNFGAVLLEAGMDYQHVVQVSVFVRDMDDYASLNEVYSRYFGGALPAREVMEVGKLPRGASVEMSCIAVL